ncbi:MAG: N-acetylmuramoyl-L-alanine amidase [Elstera sp.]
MIALMTCFKEISKAPRRFGWAVLGLLALLVLLPAPGWAEPVATGWRVGVRDGGITRFVLDVSEPVPVRVQPRGPDRVFIDLTGVTLRLDEKPPRGGIIQRAVTTLDATGRRGIELVLVRSAQIQAASLFPPEGPQRYRLVVDLVPGTPAPVTQGVPQAAAPSLGLSAPLLASPSPAPSGSAAPIPLTGLGPAPTVGLPPIAETPGNRLPNRAAAPSGAFNGPPPAASQVQAPPLPQPPVPPPAVPRPKVRTETLDIPKPAAPEGAAVAPAGPLLAARTEPAPPASGPASGIVYERAPYRPVRVIIPLGPPRLTPPPPKPDLPVIMLDPGHGGKDPGATSYSGKLEKDIVLDYARAIRERLEATGRYRVFLTRDGDALLPLRDRVALARSESAALFISIHADALADRNVMGMSVYTLSDKATDREAEALATKENKADIITGADLSGATGSAASILIELAQRDTRAASRQFAVALADELRRDIAQVNNAVRSAGFAVLTAPDMPSVLLELGYLSNPDDERRILAPDFRRRIADGVVRAVDAVLPKLTGARAG